MNLIKLGLVSCSKLKLGKKAPARRLFQGILFKKALAYAENNYDIVFLLSERYKVLKADEVIEPYKEDIYEMSKMDRENWAEAVFEDLKKHITQNTEVYFHASQYHRKILVERLDQMGITCHVPLANLQLGEQMRWYNEKMI